MSVIITEFSNSLIITQGWTHWTERLTNIWLTQTHRGGTHLTERLTNIDTKGGDAPDRKTNKHLATTESHRGGTHWTERLTIFWIPQTPRGGTHRTKRLTHTTL